MLKLPHHNKLPRDEGLNLGLDAGSLCHYRHRLLQEQQAGGEGGGFIGSSRASLPTSHALDRHMTRADAETDFNLNTPRLNYRIRNN